MIYSSRIHAKSRSGQAIAPLHAGLSAATRSRASADAAVPAGTRPPKRPPAPKAEPGCSGRRARPLVLADHTAKGSLTARLSYTGRKTTALGAPMPSRGSSTKRAASAQQRKRYWSGAVTRHSDALDLESGVFTWKDPKKIARSLRRSAEQSTRRKGSPFQSAMSMLNFYMNRAGGNLGAGQKGVLQRAKDELRALYGKDK
jgi:hypothetical protein